MKERWNRLAEDDTAGGEAQALPHRQPARLRESA
jgi:hypothetical protein